MRYKRKPAWLILLAGGMVIFMIIQVGLAAVTLVYFRATGQDGQVLLEWETATEIDNAGFFVNRSLSQNSGYTRISPFIPSEGDDLTGAIYQYYDLNVSNGVVYWYLLEAVNLDQSTDYYQPPVSAIPGNPNNTSTPTATGTLSNTPVGSLSPTATMTPTRTRTPSPTLASTATPGTQVVTEFPVYPPPATQANALSSQLGETPGSAVGENGTVAASDADSGPTATLIPLPEIALVFPTQPYESSLEELQVSQTSQSTGGLGMWLVTLSRNIVLIGLLCIVWVILGGIYFLSSRQFE